MPSVPKPTKGDRGGHVTCYNCGTDSFYSIEDMLKHKTWCKPAKAKADTAAKNKKAHSNRIKLRR